MQTRSPDLLKKLEKMAAHYMGNVANPYVKGEFPNLTLSRRDWDEIELITTRQELFRQQGYHIDELYMKLLSLARFVKQVRSQLVPNVKKVVSLRYGSKSAQERLMAEMVVANFPSNVNVLAEMIQDLFFVVRQEDADQNQGQEKTLAKVPEAKEIENLLRG